jgi:DNA-binding XRE family transcriptional regulator
MLASESFTSPDASATLSATVDIDWHIGDVIRALRKRQRGRMSQTTLAKKVGVNKATIVRAEAGDPKVSRKTYINIAKVLGTDLAFLEVEAARLASHGLIEESHEHAPLKKRRSV